MSWPLLIGGGFFTICLLIFLFVVFRPRETAEGDFGLVRRAKAKAWAKLERQLVSDLADAEYHESDEAFEVIRSKRRGSATEVIPVGGRALPAISPPNFGGTALTSIGKA